MSVLKSFAHSSQGLVKVAARSVHVQQPRAAWPRIRERVHDADRTHYLATHIGAVGEALAAGVPMAGYMVWSLLDNFEWSSGYAKRFGIVHVDYDTQVRTPKDSARWYRDLVGRCRAVRATGAA